MLDLASADPMLVAVFGGWVQFFTAAASAYAQNRAQKKKGTQGPQGPSNPVGVSHAGVEQSRRAADPFYAEAVRRASEIHGRQFGVPWDAVATPAWAVQEAVEAQLVNVKAENWQPAPATPAKPTGAIAGALGLDKGSVFIAGLGALVVAIMVFKRR